MWFIHPMEYYLVVRKNEILPFAATWMELEDIMLSEIKSVRERQISYVFTHSWNLRNLTEDHGRREGGKIVTNREGGRQTMKDSKIQRTN